jgi:uncharacterized protein YggE
MEDFVFERRGHLDGFFVNMIDGKRFPYQGPSAFARDEARKAALKHAAALVQGLIARHGENCGRIVFTGRRLQLAKPINYERLQLLYRQNPFVIFDEPEQ